MRTEAKVHKTSRMMPVVETYNYVRLAQQCRNTDEGRQMNRIIKKLKRFLHRRRRKGRKTIVNVRRFRPF